MWQSDGMNLLFMIYITSWCILCLGYPLYLTLLLILGRKTPVRTSPDDFEVQPPFVSILIPSYNEGQFIHDKIKNTLELAYPPNFREIIFIDNSNDGTKQVLAALAAENPDVKLIHQEGRGGKPAALNLGLSQAQGDFIIITDVDAILQRNCITLLVKRLQDPKCGLAGAFTEVTGRSRTQNLEQKYWGLSNIIRVLEARVDSATSVIAACYAYKKRLIPRFDEAILADDMWACLTSREQGFQSDYLQKAKALDYGTANSLLKDFFHKTRKGYACLQVLSQFKHMLFNAKFGVFGNIIIPSYVIRHVFCPYAFVFLLFSGILLITTSYLMEVICLLGVMVFWSFTILHYINLSEPGNDDDVPNTRFQQFLQTIFMFAVLQMALIVAQWAWLSGAYNVQWKKTR